MSAGYQREFAAIPPSDHHDGFQDGIESKTRAPRPLAAINRFFRAPRAELLEDRPQAESLRLEDLWQIPETRYRC